MRTISPEEVTEVLHVRHPGLADEIKLGTKDADLATKYGEKETTIRRWRLELGVKRKRVAGTNLDKVSLEDLEAEIARRKG